MENKQDLCFKSKVKEDTSSLKCQKVNLYVEHTEVPKKEKHIPHGCVSLLLVEEFKLEDEKYNTERGSEEGHFPEKTSKGVDIGKYMMSLENSK